MDSGEYVDDSVINTKVKAAILEEPALSCAEINVETFKGTVQLSGFLGSPRRYQKSGCGGTRRRRREVRQE